MLKEPRQVPKEPKEPKVQEGDSITTCSELVRSMGQPIIWLWIISTLFSGSTTNVSGRGTERFSITFGQSHVIKKSCSGRFVDTFELPLSSRGCLYVDAY